MFYPCKVSTERISIGSDTRSSLQKSETKSGILIMPGTEENSFQTYFFY